jgi:hypothetical protein
MAGPQAALQHQLDALRQARLHLAPDILGPQRPHPRIVGVACLHQQVQVGVHHGDVLRLQPRHAGGDQIDDRLHRLGRQRLAAGQGQHHAGLRLPPFPREGLAPRQHQVHAGPDDATHRLDGPRQLTLQRAGQLHLLVEVGRREVIAAVEDLVAGGAAH